MDEHSWPSIDWDGDVPRFVKSSESTRKVMEQVRQETARELTEAIEGEKRIETNEARKKALKAWMQNE